MGRGRLVISMLAGTAAAASALLLVAGGSAGTGNYEFAAAAGPPTVSSGQTGFVVAKFQPDKGSGASSHTVITFTFPTDSVSGPLPGANSSPDCGTATQTGSNYVVNCNVGTVTPGKLVKRFVTFTAGAATDDARITATFSFDHGSQKSKGGGAVDGPDKVIDLTITDGTNAAGRCEPSGADIATDTEGPQQTALSFGETSEEVPCSWGTVSVIDVHREGNHAPEVSSVGGVLYDEPATVTLSFDSLPTDFKLQESENFNPDNPQAADWTEVPQCATEPTTHLQDGVDACVIGHEMVGDGRPGQHCDGDRDEDDAGCVIEYTLLYRGSNAGPAGGTDPWFN